MRDKAIKDLSQLSDKDLFDEVSMGIKAVLENARRIAQDAEVLRNQKLTSCRILSYLSEEEAAKCLILIDAIRCPRRPPEIFIRQLARFNDHLAKGLYAESCWWLPEDFEELSKAVERERKEFYLDGPNDIDWIFRKQILSGREGSIYVDYAEGDDGKHMWIVPDRNSYLLPNKPEALELAEALYNSGCISPDSLKVISEFWRSIIMKPEFTWLELRG